MFLGNKGRSNVALALGAMLLFALACKFGDETGEANKLVDQANAEIKEAKKLQETNEAKVGDYKAALNASDFDKATSILDGVTKDIDTGLKHGDTAAEYLEKGTKLKIDAKFKEYLELRAQSIRKRIDSYKALKEVLTNTKEMLTVRTPAAVQAALPKIKDAQEKARSLEKEANELEEKSDKVRKENPDKFQK